MDTPDDTSGTATRDGLSDMEREALEAFDAEREAALAAIDPERTHREALETMRDNIDRAQRFVQGFDLAAFLADAKTFYAVARCFEIIKTAGGRVPPSFIYPESWEREDDPDASVHVQVRTGHVAEASVSLRNVSTTHNT